MVAFEVEQGIAALLVRANALVGTRLVDVARGLRLSVEGDPVRTKGTAGAIVERALGATGGSTKAQDFPDLGVELKSIPVDDRGAPSESTHVCTLSLADAETQEWESSWVRAKLRCVLFVPLVGDAEGPWPMRRIGVPVLWRPTPEQEAVLRFDFEEIVGLIGVGRIEELTAHRGRWLQVRPKAAHGRVRTVAFGAEGEAIAAVPRGFYLRPRLTRAILVDPQALPM